MTVGKSTLCSRIVDLFVRRLGKARRRIVCANAE
jgi:hypothetical protein